MSVVLLLYSKYSPACEKIQSMMAPVLDFRKICVDNCDIRNLVLRDKKKFSIEMVPCILVFWAEGVMKKYEGPEAFTWVQETLHKMTNITKNVVQTTPIDQKAPPQQQVGYQDEHAGFHEFHAPVLEVKTTSAPSPSSPSPSKENFDMKRQMDSAPLLLPREPQQSNKQQSVKEPSSEEQTMRGIKSDRHENVMSLAQLMQKQRDQEEETIHPNAIQKISDVP